MFVSMAPPISFGMPPPSIEEFLPLNEVLERAPIVTEEMLFQATRYH
jgi:hypothetical protein